MGLNDAEPFDQKRTRRVNALLLRDLTGKSIYRLLLDAYTDGWRDCYEHHDVDRLKRQLAGQLSEEQHSA